MRVRLSLAVLLSTALAAAAAPLGSMVVIPAETYAPLSKSQDKVAVASYRLDAYPATNGEFLEFVREHPAWQRSNVKRIFADESYLQQWAGDLDLGAADARSPVTGVSWFAAKAYAQARGKRLPTVAEWELAAAASETNAVGADEPGYNQRIIDWYSRPRHADESVSAVGSTYRNFWGVYDMHGLVWEWVSDFGAPLSVGESRGDGDSKTAQFCGAGPLSASDAKDYAAYMRFAFRSSLKANYCVGNLGFRCAKGVAEETMQPTAQASTTNACSSASVYNLGDAWTSQDGKPVRLADFEGDVVVLAMFFTSCDYACPRTVADMQAIERLVPAELTPHVRYVLASFDVRRDLPARLTLYADAHGLSAATWTLLHGDEEAVQNLAAALGVKFEHNADGSYSHSMLITVLDRQGELVHQQEGLGADPQESVQSILKMLVPTQP